MEDFPLVMPPGQKRLNQSEALELFVTILSDVHKSKVSLVSELPFIVSMAFAKDVKLHLLESATAINGQLIRVSLTKALLGLSLTTKPPMLNGCLSLDRYLKENVKDKSIKTDVIILTYLIIAEGIENDAFKVLLQLAKAIKAKGVAKLMSTCCQEANQTKKALKVMLSLYE